MINIDNTIKHIGTKIKYYRRLNKISLSKLAAEAGISKSTLFGLEEGRSNPTISTLINISSTLNIDLNELIGDGLKDSNIGSQLVLISKPLNENYKLYKLTLSPYELFTLNSSDSKKVNISLLEGSLNLIDISTTLYSNESTVANNRLFKAQEKGAIALLKIYSNNTIVYLKNDIYHNKPTKEILETVANSSLNGLITRVIFNSLSPTNELEKIKYINYFESIEDKESHYYFYRRYLGLIGGAKNILSKLNYKEESLDNLEKFITINNTKEQLDKDVYNYIKLDPFNDAKTAIESAIKGYEPTIQKIDTIKSLYNINLKKGQKVYLLSDLLATENSSKQITMLISIYRAFEMLYIVKNSSLTSEELELFNNIIKHILKGLYYAYCDFTDTAIDYIKNIVEYIETTNIDENLQNSKFIANYLAVNQALKVSIENYKIGKQLNSVELIELVAKDLNLNIELKELVAPVINNAGLYCYIFSKN